MRCSTNSITELTFFRGRVALCAILNALDLRRDDSVALQAFTCVAVPEAILAAGTRPRFVDVAENSFTMDPLDLERKLEPRTKAIIFQHTFGIPGWIGEVAEIAKRKGIPLIEDCCHSYLSTANGRDIGSFGTASFYSFEWGKPLVAGMGGSAVTSDDGLREKLHRRHDALQDPPMARRLRIELEYLGYRVMFRPALYWVAKRLKGALGKLGVVESSYNGHYGEGASSDFQFRMSPSCRLRLESAVGNIQGVADNSDWISRQYRDRIRCQYVTHPWIHPGSNVVFGRYPLTSPHKDTIMRLASRAMVEVAGWYSSPVHPLIPHQWKSVGYARGSCPNAERRAAEVLTLPTHSRVTQRDVDRTVTFFNSLQL